MQFDGRPACSNAEVDMLHHLHRDMTTLAILMASSIKTCDIQNDFHYGDKLYETFFSARVHFPLSALNLRLSVNNDNGKNKNNNSVTLQLPSLCRMESRKLPPHQVEVDAIQQNSTQIFHKIHFPNDAEEVTPTPQRQKVTETSKVKYIPTVIPAVPLTFLQIFEVATNTRIKDLIQNITKKLSLASSDGFSIFVKTHDKVCLLKPLYLDFLFLCVIFHNALFHERFFSCLFQVLSLNDTDYFFDSLRQITDWSKKANRSKDGKTLLSDGRARQTSAGSLHLSVRNLVCVVQAAQSTCPTLCSS